MTWGFLHLNLVKIKVTMFDPENLRNTLAECIIDDFVFSGVCVVCVFSTCCGEKPAITSTWATSEQTEQVDAQKYRKQCLHLS